MSNDVGTPPKPSWRIAEQYFRYNDFEIETQPHNDGYVATIKMGFKTRRVFFDPAGRVTHVLNLNDPKAQVVDGQGNDVSGRHVPLPF